MGFVLAQSKEFPSIKPGKILFGTRVLPVTFTVQSDVIYGRDLFKNVNPNWRPIIAVTTAPDQSPRLSSSTQGQPPSMGSPTFLRPVGWSPRGSYGSSLSDSPWHLPSFCHSTSTQWVAFEYARIFSLTDLSGKSEIMNFEEMWVHKWGKGSTPNSPPPFFSWHLTGLFQRVPITVFPWKKFHTCAWQRYVWS